MTALRKIRYDADKDSLLWISDENGKQIGMGLLINESLTGCNGVLREAESLEKGNVYLVKPGEIAALRAKLRWRKKLAEGVFQVGFEYLD